MPTFRVWAVQVLHDANDVEAESLDEARQKAKSMYDESGDLDPYEVIDGAFGVVGDTEFQFKELPVNKDEPVSYLACPECGCTDIECTAWVNVNDDAVSSSDPPNDMVWCPQCSYNGAEGTMKYRFLVNVSEKKPTQYEESRTATVD